ncbi:hypothetical protein PINS_up020081 [Pythium insidiosum]|nr:hypothetical protein PINS_up020081 [Pythium insidiosum]
MFTTNFLAWDKSFFEQNEFVDPYEARLRKLKEEKEKNKPKDSVGTISSESFRKPAASAAPPAPVVAASGGKGQTFSYEQLLAGVDGIDITARESYLSDAEFLKVMGHSKDEFYKLPKWRQQSKKKEVNLF